MIRLEVVCARRTWRSRWIASCLPLAERALRRAQRVVEAIDQAVGLDNYRSVLDAAVAAVLPELREPMRRFYEQRGPALREGFPAEAVARFDERLAWFVKEVAPLVVGEIAGVLASLLREACPLDHPPRGSL